VKAFEVELKVAACRHRLETELAQGTWPPVPGAAPALVPAAAGPASEAGAGRAGWVEQGQGGATAARSGTPTQSVRCVREMPPDCVCLCCSLVGVAVASGC